MVSGAASVVGAPPVVVARRGTLLSRSGASLDATSSVNGSGPRLATGSRKISPAAPVGSACAGVLSSPSSVT